jgi:hypothetical protein
MLFKVALGEVAESLVLIALVRVATRRVMDMTGARPQVLAAKDFKRESLKPAVAAQLQGFCDHLFKR